MEVLIGLTVGLISGLLGIGGGVILVPVLSLLSYPILQAVSISIFTMVFTSIYGSILNFKEEKKYLKDGIIIGVGGFLGGTQSHIIQDLLGQENLWYLFITVVVFAMLKIMFEPPLGDRKDHSSPHYMILFPLGFIIGMFGLAIGIGGSVILVPILISFLKYDLKHSTAIGLLFVLFASIGAFIYQIINDNIYLYESLMVTIPGLLGIYIGTKFKSKIQTETMKKLLLLLNIGILIIVICEVMK